MFANLDLACNLCAFLFGYSSMHKHVAVLGSPQPPYKASANSSYPKLNRRFQGEAVTIGMLA